jgi:acetyltransferase-like isoleucine patch superfamily enzyme
MIAIEGYEKGKVVIGPHTYGDPQIRFSGEGEVEIGKFCSIAAGVVIYAGGNHRTDWITTFPLGHKGLGRLKPDASRSKGKVVIGNGVWLGDGVMIMSGATIGDGAVIGAYSVVRGNIPPYAVAYGNPCAVRRMLFPQEVIDRLLEMKWWDWDLEKIKEHSELLESGNMDWIMQEGSKA